MYIHTPASKTPYGFKASAVTPRTHTYNSQSPSPNKHKYATPRFPLHLPHRSSSSSSSTKPKSHQDPYLILLLPTSDPRHQRRPIRLRRSLRAKLPYRSRDQRCDIREEQRCRRPRGTLQRHTIFQYWGLSLEFLFASAYYLWRYVDVDVVMMYHPIPSTLQRLTLKCPHT